MMTITIHGARELQNKLDNLPQKVARKVISEALRDGAKIIQQKQKSNALTMVGGAMGRLLNRYIIVRKAKGRQKKGIVSINCLISEKGNNEFIQVAKFGLRKTRKAHNPRTYIPAAIEYGHLAGDGSQVKPIPFMRDGYHATKHKALSVILAKIKTGIDREAK